MPRKQYEETPYDPIAADLAREVGAAGRVSFTKPPPTPVVEIRTVAKTEMSTQFPRTLPRKVEPNITKRCLLTRKEDDDFNAFLLRLQTQACTKVTFSVIVRAALHAVMQAEEQILREIGDRFPQEFPSTHDSVGLGEFEDRWSRCLVRALRKLPQPNLAGGQTTF